MLASCQGCALPYTEGCSATAALGLACMQELIVWQVPASAVNINLNYSISTAGMDFYVVLERPGYRVGRRRRAVSTVGIQHKVTKEDSMKW